MPAKRALSEPCDPPSKRHHQSYASHRQLRRIEQWRASVVTPSGEGCRDDNSPDSPALGRERSINSYIHLAEKGQPHIPPEEWSEPADSEMSHSFSEGQSEGSSAIGPTDPDYEVRLRERRIFYMRKNVQPSNLEEVEAALAATRNSPEPDNVTAENFHRRVRKSGNEGGAMQGLLPKILPIIDRFWDSEDDAHPVDQQWDRRMLLLPEIRPSLKPPKPDQAFGFTPEAFPFPQASLHIKSAMSPARDFAWPYFTIESKGRQGHLDVARLQNSHNGAVMLNNMLQLKQLVGNEREFFGRIAVMTMELTTESISLSGHLVIKNAGTLEYDSKCLYCASAVDPSGKAFKESYKQAMNAVEFLRRQTLTWITKDMAALESSLVKTMQQGLENITPPTSCHSRSQSRKRRGSSQGSRGTSRSDSVSRKRSTLSSQLEPLGDNTVSEATGKADDGHEATDLQQFVEK